VAVEQFEARFERLPVPLVLKRFLDLIFLLIGRIRGGVGRAEELVGSPVDRELGARGGGRYRALVPADLSDELVEQVVAEDRVPFESDLVELVDFVRLIEAEGRCRSTVRGVVLRDVVAQ